MWYPCGSSAGSLPGYTSGSATWLVAGREAAAPVGPTDYNVGGVLRYTIGGLSSAPAVTVPLTAVRITVLPQPRLQALYFIQRYVQSDNPFTAQVSRPRMPPGTGMPVAYRCVRHVLAMVWLHEQSAVLCSFLPLASPRARCIWKGLMPPSMFAPFH